MTDLWGVEGRSLKSIHMSLVFVTLSWRNALHHTTKSSITGPWLFSSACKRLTISCGLQQSSVYRIQSKGERTQHWGDPVGEDISSDIHPFTVTLWVLLVKKSRIRPKILKSKPKLLINLSIRMWGWIVLIADEKSTNSSLACFLLPSRCLKTRLSRVVVAHAQPWKQTAMGQAGAQFGWEVLFSPVFQIT